jgi:putative glutamine amidotransferase
MQVMAVGYGGSLIQHLPDVLGSDHHAPAPGVVGAHPVVFAEGSLIGRILGARAEVNSYHHQGVADPGRLAVTGRGDDGVIEVVEDPTKRFVLGVQWHPEAMAQPALFEALTEAATRSQYAAR